MKGPTGAGREVFLEFSLYGVGPRFLRRLRSLSEHMVAS